MSDAVSAAAPAVVPEPARARKRAPGGLFAAAAVSALLVLLPLAFTVWRAASFGFAEAVELVFRPLVGELLVEYVDDHGVGHFGLRCDRYSCGLVYRTHPPARPPFLGRGDGRAARDAAVHHELCVGIVQSRSAGLQRRVAGHYVRVFSAGLSAGRSCLAQHGPGSRRKRPLARLWPLEHFLSRDPAATAPCSARRHAAGRARCDVRIRRIHAAAFSHLHDRDLRRIPYEFRRPRRIAAGLSADRDVSHCAGLRIPRARGRAIRTRRSRHAPRGAAL